MTVYVEQKNKRNDTYTAHRLLIEIEDGLVIIRGSNNQDPKIGDSIVAVYDARSISKIRKY